MTTREAIAAVYRDWRAKDSSAHPDACYENGLLFADSLIESGLLNDQRSVPALLDALEERDARLAEAAKLIRELIYQASTGDNRSVSRERDRDRAREWLANPAESFGVPEETQ